MRKWAVPKPDAVDLRERIVAAVGSGPLQAEAARRFAVSFASLKQPR